MKIFVYLGIFFVVATSFIYVVHRYIKSQEKNAEAVLGEDGLSSDSDLGEKKKDGNSPGKIENSEESDTDQSMPCRNLFLGGNSGSSLFKPSKGLLPVEDDSTDNTNPEDSSATKDPINKNDKNTRPQRNDSKGLDGLKKTSKDKRTKKARDVKAEDKLTPETGGGVNNSDQSATQNSDLEKGKSRFNMGLFNNKRVYISATAIALISAGLGYYYGFYL